MFSRRKFILVGLGVGSAVGTLSSGASASPTAARGALDDTVTLWRLSADWGYPAGPKGKTRCKGQACHSHAANKIYETEAAALAGRLHVCCVAQPVSFEIPADVHHDMSAAPPTPRRRPKQGPELTDLRYQGLAEAWRRAVMAAEMTETTGTTGAGRYGKPAQLASTGGSTSALAAGGLALGAAGVAALVISRRETATADGPETGSVSDE